MRRKGNLPEKNCVECQRPFTWRKKWARCWDQVRYCSERCRRSAKQPYPKVPASMYQASKHL
ncbi:MULTISPECIES: DUF2256 domain-containing protein [unclassified Halomonas]|uniref:DUF2256 domain-containing protein n=1 Tax=unclassified Halomonas TaxID=2609666 RepID=UPI001CF5C574|nr:MULTISPECIES: DUF2256 domain-containing protein [unclassified Halomonas]MCA8866886.1 DUF2256 domain-containing protein [Halomonas sp. SBBP1]UZH12391.1 DUF2256 domain-containing protein [Halomonas sp. BDJS001]